MSNVDSNKDEEVLLPGFRFHPTDEELVQFYLRRKVEKKPISIEIIKQIDIYKYDPWDLPKSGNAGDKEWYYYCKRGRKYRNSVRPNRVTGSGFWKATGIDKPIYGGNKSGDGHECIGLKKSLVYYKGSAGKGTKTDWMMHEFRLPADHEKSFNHSVAKITTQEAEIWTLCRIFKRNLTYKKYIPDWRDISAKRNKLNDASSKTCSVDSGTHESYISFQAHPVQKQINKRNQSSSISQAPLFTASCSSFLQESMDEFLCGSSWDELRSVVEFANNPSHL